MTTPVFKPQDFRLLRRPCKRYDTRTTREVELHTANPIAAGASAHYATSFGTNIGTGCYRTLPLRGHGHN